MAILNDLIVKGSSRFIGSIFGDLKGKSNTLNVNRVTKNANVTPTINSCIMEEYNSGDYNLPTNDNTMYQILTTCGNNVNYATQLAISLFGSKAYIRGYTNGTWATTWNDLIPGNATTSSSGLMSATDKSKLDILNETGTFTANVVGSVSGTKFSTNGGYTRHGNTVSFHIYIFSTTAVTNTDGYITITGLPYSASSDVPVNLTYCGGMTGETPYLYAVDSNNNAYVYSDNTLSIPYTMVASVSGTHIEFSLSDFHNSIYYMKPAYWRCTNQIRMWISGTYLIS